MPGFHVVGHNYYGKNMLKLRAGLLSFTLKSICLYGSKHAWIGLHVGHLLCTCAFAMIIYTSRTRNVYLHFCARNLFAKAKFKVHSTASMRLFSQGTRLASLLICTVEVSCERATILVSILLPLCPLLIQVLKLDHKSPSYVHSSYLHAGSSFCKFHLPHSWSI